jgi:dienelactone hydrolase
MLMLSAALPAGANAGDAAYGPYGPEGPRMREQLWMVPGGDKDRALRATVFRPADHSAAPLKRPLVIINHGTSESTRLSVAMPVFYWLSRWFVERDYVVVLPQRRGHGATGGALDEAVGNCAQPDHLRSGDIAADDIAAVVNYMARQPFIAANEIVVAGVSTGGWASLALAARNPAQVRAVVNFAGGRGGHADGRPNAVCGERLLIDAAGIYARTARIPTLWLYASNDSYFGPALAGKMARTWSSAGGKADLHVLPAYGAEGHDVSSDEAGWKLWGPPLETFLHAISEPPTTARAQTMPSPVETSENAGAGAGDAR